ncbi:MAG: N-acetylglucosamine-6-sulfatase [Thermoleophilaceae bacterium]|nr:N-acetylglucosamine-6-sulfatase [Thermoleophilaceae bacterium]
MRRVLLLAVAALLAAAGPAAAQQVKPNVVVIETDDQDQQSMWVMNKTNRLIGGAGAVFKNNVVSFPLCCPSRASFLTGQYAHNNGITSNDPPTGGYQVFENINALPVWLQGAGYYTAMVGRYLNHYGKTNPTEIPAGWSEWHAGVDPSTYKYYNYTVNHQGTLVYYGDQPADYQTDVWNATATELIRRRAAKPQPFFLWLTPMAPHDAGPREPEDPKGFPTTVPPPRYKGIYADAHLPKGPAFSEYDVSDKPREVRRRRQLTFDDITKIRYAYRQRLETLRGVDDMVGDVVRALEDSGELQNTLIIYTSDNGYLQGEHRIRAGKVFLYEPSLRVPLQMRGPGVPRGMKVQRWSSNVDLAPTILEATGAIPGRTQDGRSLFPLLRDPTLSWGRELLLDTGDYQGVRTDRYVYAEHATGEKELYDLQNDKYELHNLWKDPDSQPIWNAMAGQLQRLRHCNGPNCQRGPRVQLELKRVGTICKRRSLLARLRGQDNHYVIEMDLTVDGHRVAVDTRPPFAVRLRSSSLRHPSQLRAFAILKDGRRLSIDRTANGC